MRGSEPSPVNVSRPQPVFGSPVQDSVCWDGMQSYPDTCAIRCQEFILQQFTGVDVDEDQLVREAADHGWYRPGGGTSTEDVGNLLELHGLPVNRYQHATVFHLANELAQGHKVIVSVDSQELWTGSGLLQQLAHALGLYRSDHAADHAVVVSGIDTSEWPHTYVIVSDPGTGDPFARYPLEQFVSAWKSGDFFMVATQQPAPPHLPEMVHFDYGLGHVPQIAGVPYDSFLTFADRPGDWDQIVHDYAESHFVDLNEHALDSLHQDGHVLDHADFDPSVPHDHDAGGPGGYPEHLDDSPHHPDATVHDIADHPPEQLEEPAGDNP